MYRAELIALMLKMAVLWKVLDRADLTDGEQVEALAEQAQNIELMANELSSEFMGLAHFLEEVQR